MEEKKDVADILAQAENLLYQDVEREIEEMRGDIHATPSHLNKYEEAKVLFEKVQQVDPENEQAKEGLAACNEMLVPYVPVQYLVPVPDHIDLKAIEIPISPRAEESPGTKQLPWEYRREIRGRDEKGLRYTGQQLGKALEEARGEVKTRVEKARLLVEQDGRIPEDIYREYEKQFEQFQEHLHQSWKGHGPEILEEALRLLRQALGYNS